MRQMKDSGVEWIGKIPENWDTIKCKFVLLSNCGGIWGDDPTDSGVNKIVIRSTEQTIDGKWCIDNPAIRDLSSICYTNYRITPNDLLITKSSGSSLHIGKTCLADEWFNKNESYYSNFIQRLKVDEEQYNPKLLWYIFNSVIAREQFAYLQNSTSGIGNINADDIKSVIIPICSNEKQKRIVRYLDEKCAKIDNLIANQQAQIEKLKEYKQAIITEAVTKGLDPDAPMKDSGVKWIGQIPESWRVCKLKAIADTKQENSFIDGDWIESLYIQDKGIRYLTSGNIGDGIFKRQGNGFISEESFTLLRCKYAFPMDLIFSRLNEEYGRSCILPYDYDKYVIAVDNVILRTLENKKYICYITQCPNYHSAVFFYARGTAMKRISRTNLGNLAIPLPLIEEQNEIVDYLDKKCADIDSLISIKQQKIEKLQEYKKSLIYEYVTGKKEVC